MQNNRLKHVEITKDGSPTMRMGLNSSELHYSESMHYSSGAASETIYIYGEALKRAQEMIPSSSTNYLVVGLGLGYIEILISLLTQGNFKHILSFEKDDELRQDFLNWISGVENFKLYEDVQKSLLDHFQFKPSFDLIKTSLKKKLVVNRALENPFYSSPYKYNVICYDAFSYRMDETLWDYDFLNQFISHYCATPCVFASYAKKGVLSRALKQNGFTLLDRKGFSTKRESTLAFRN